MAVSSCEEVRNLGLVEKREFIQVKVELPEDAQGKIASRNGIARFIGAPV